jgi:hypothetical protein
VALDRSARVGTAPPAEYLNLLIVKASLCEDRPMSTPRWSRDTRLATRFGTQAQIVGAATGRRFVYEWNAPRSPALRVLFVPAFLVAGMLVLLLAALVLAALLVLAIAAVVVLALASGLNRVASRLTIRRSPRRG